MIPSRVAVVVRARAARSAVCNRTYSRRAVSPKRGGVAVVVITGARHDDFTAHTEASVARTLFLYLSPTMATTGEDDARDAPCSTTKRGRIVLFGDSLTQRAFEAPNGWGASLANAFTRTADTFNRGYGGYNSRWCLRIAPHVFSTLGDAYEETFLVTIMLGTNDATTMRDADAQTRNRVHVPVEEYRANLREIIALALDVAMHVVVMTPPVVDHEQRAVTQQERYDDAWLGSVWEDERLRIGEYAQAARDVVRELAKEYNNNAELTSEIGKRLVLADVHEATKEAKSRGEDIFCDGVHFNGAGQMLVFNTLMREVREMKFVQYVEEVPDYPYGHDVRTPKDSSVVEETIFAAHEEFRRSSVAAFRTTFRNKAGGNLS